MKKLLALAAVLAAVAIPATASAAVDHGYGLQPGFEVATGNTVCAGAGAFGAFGAQGDVRHDNGPNSPDGINGANGYQTGLNNSALCGNR
jgi:opacity protein-like surface antigen